jgi:uracil-DNA glycosylase
MSPDPRAFESLMAFWADAGVDTLYEEAARDRVHAPVPPRPAPVAASRPTAMEAPAPPPVNLDAARRAAAAAHTLEELAGAIAAYEGCDLKRQGARQAVFSRGRGDAPIMLIGEAPGADEDVQGAPFVGRAGQLLDRMLAAAGLTDRVFITNTVFWRPPGNRTPTPAEQLSCAPFLERAIALVNPRLIMLLGGAAAKALLNPPEGILKTRGQWFTWKAADSEQAIPTLPTLHPSFLLRQPGAKKQAWSDFLTLAARLENDTQ